MKHICTSGYLDIKKWAVKKYHYKYSDLKQFLAQGFEEGNNGFILTETYDNFSVFRGFGTIENPIKHLQTFTVEDDPFMKESFEIKENYEPTHSHKIVIWDASK